MYSPSPVFIFRQYVCKKEYWDNHYGACAMLQAQRG